MARKYREEAEKLDRMIEDIYGFSYPDTDDDQLIDPLDYGTD
ncbi:hypothetical protein JSO61_000360 [Riemerella anatipestifer]